VRNLVDSLGYTAAADFFLAHGVLEDVHHVFYAVPIFIISFFRWIFLGEVIPFLIFQCVISWLAVCALYKATTKIFDSNTAGFLTTLIFLLWLDNIHWNVAVMTESLTCSMICFIIYTLSH
jgi:hypothetical protein